jgi:beta-lactamase class A
VVALLLGLWLLLAPGASRPGPSPTPIADRPSSEGVLEIPLEQVVVPTVAGAPTPDPATVAQQRLKEAVFSPFRQVRGRFGIVVKELSTGHTVTLNENFQFQAASLYKLPVMYETFRQRDEGMLTFSEELTIGPDDVAMDLGSLLWPVGTRITLGTALERMIILSDNSSAFMLVKRLSSARVNEGIQLMGLTNTRVQGDDLTTSAADMGKLLESIATGRAVDRRASGEMANLMARGQVRNRIPVLIPPDAIVANKTGNLDTVAHDVAIVYTPRSTFVIALLSDLFTDVEALYGAMAWSARNVYDLTMNPEFGSQPNPGLPTALVGTYASAPKLPPGAVVPAAPAAPRGSEPRAPAAPVAPAPAQPIVRPKPPSESGPSSPPLGPARRPDPTPAQSKPTNPAAKPAGAPAKPTVPATQPSDKPNIPPLFNPAPGSLPAPQPTPASKPR